MGWNDILASFAVKIVHKGLIWVHRKKRVSSYKIWGACAPIHKLEIINMLDANCPYYHKVLAIEESKMFIVWAIH